MCPQLPHLVDVGRRSEPLDDPASDHVPRSGVAPAIAVLSGRSRGMGQLAAAGRLMSGSSLIAAMV
ncbi:hypothetical protein, partial [Ensifer sp. ENS05]|uniref:hypothetical protein n=1 Tax=Ensifer sp. ENS05 TaxID=2769277 RepID=UPI001AEDB231